MKKFFAMMLALLLMCAPAFAESDGIVTVTPPTGGKASFSLPGNPTTGYQWYARLIADGVVEFDNPEGVYVQDEAEEGLTGVGGVYTFTLTATVPGENIVVFEYLRSWERKIIDRRIFLITVADDLSVSVRDVTADGVMQGTVLSVDAEAHSALLRTENDEVLAHFPADMQLPAADEEITVFFNGAITMSLPGQIGVIGWEHVRSAIER